MPGRFASTPLGETFLVEEHYPPDYLHGNASICLSCSFRGMAAYIGESRLKEASPNSFAFLDTETTGLSGGTGTYAFLIGVARFEGDRLHLAQFFMRDPAEEPAQLASLEEFLAPCNTLVTFNGKAFDVPLLNTRFTRNGWRTPLNDFIHVDLLPLARRLWRDRLPSRTLGNLEYRILGHLRSEQDIPGWEIPSIYFRYLRDGDARDLSRVFYHNAVDVVSMAALLNHMGSLLDDPFDVGVEHSVDVIALAKLFESMRDYDSATRLYIDGLNREDLPKEALLQAIERLALIYKRAGKYEKAVPLWEQSACYGLINAHEELAKHYEHNERDYAAAREWTVKALTLVGQPRFPRYELLRWLPDLEHRLDRLERKISRSSG